MVSPAIKQTWAVMGVLLNMVGQGMVLSFPSILLPAIQAPDSEIRADLHVASWVASCVGISSIPALLILSYVMDWYGRKKAQIITMIPGIIGWILIYLSTNITTLLIGRVLCGLTAGASLTLGAVIIGEYTSPKNRGMFLNLKTTAVSFGNMIVHIFGHFLVWKYVALVALVPHIVAILIVFTWPESPAWLVSKKRFNSSQKSFYWLRGTSSDSRREIEELIQAQKEKLKFDKSTSISEKLSELCNKFTKKDFLKPMIVMVFCGLLLEACGRHIFPAYAIQIIREVTGNSADSFYYTLGIDLIITVSTLFSSALVKVLKRRTLLFSSGFAALFILACVCLYLYLTANGIISKDRPWIPILLFSGYFILSNLGCTPIPLALLGELFPLAYRGVGSNLAGILLSLYLIIGMQVTPFLLVGVKVYGTFAVFGSATGLALVVLCFILPETKDRTLQEIEDYFSFGEFRNDVIDNDEEAKIKMIANQI
ncbi:facilitated trehalose transporter Tret1-like isoform X1 [Maniola hyperantus]|uniref:facilitated trehalose transporter Tret1-like isoform X1 n=2 Tax=Aphantopus hyperantus TaxID=2795564 RepID=UPI00212FA9BE